MAKTSPKNIALAIFESIKDKEGKAVDSIIESSSIFIRDHNLLGRKEEILNALEDIINKKNGVVKVRVSTSNNLDQKVKNEIDQFVKKRYKAKKVIIENKVIPSLLGGIRIEIGDEVIDATVSNKVNQLQKFLITN